jgi:hypothetical protein
MTGDDLTPRERPAPEHLPASPAAPGDRPTPEHLPAPEAPTTSPYLQGLRTAGAILGGIAALEGVVALAYWATGGGQATMLDILAMLIAGGGLAVLVLAGRRLPPAARVPFWAVGAICLGIGFVVLGATCGLLFS